jgi:hypothetical protein
MLMDRGPSGMKKGGRVVPLERAVTTVREVLTKVVL